MKVKFTLFDIEEVIEFDDDITQNEIDEEFDSWVDNNLQCFWEEV